MNKEITSTDIDDSQESDTSDKDDSQAKKKQHEEILATAKKRFDLAVEAETDIRAEALDDLKFSAGDQWPDNVKRDREMDQRPCLTINRLPQFIHQITNEQRQNRPGGRVSPVDSGADIDTAEVLQGIVRHIENDSNADFAYDTAFDGAVRKGIGYWRIITEYCDPYSFNQDIKIKRIRDSFSVYFDPNSQEPDGSDANWAFIFDDMSIDDYKSAYADSELANLDDWRGLGDEHKDWIDDERVRVAEYYYKEYESVDLVLLSTGETMEKAEFKKVEEQLKAQGVTVKGERTSQKPIVKWCKFNALEILEETIWPVKWIPIIPVYGDEVFVEGKRILEGIVRHAKDPQRMYNFWASAETETIALAPKAPFIGAEGQFEGHEAKWQTANTRNHAFLEYKPKSLNGTPMGQPQRQVYEPPVQAITNARLQSAEDLKNTTGIYDASLGNRSNETSGIAVQRRTNQAQTSNFHFMDNLRRSLKHGYRILVALIPVTYDTARQIRIIGEEDKEEIIRVNEMFNRDGKPVQYNLDVGKYDVAVDVGPNFATKRQEAALSMEGMAKAWPQLVQIAGDLMVKNMDWPGAREIAERIKKTLPPNLSGDDQQQEIPPQVQAQLQQMGQMIEQLTGQLNESNQVINQKRMEIESKERIEFAKIEADLTKETFKAAPQLALIQAQQQINDANKREELVGMSRPVDGAATQPNQDLNSMGQGEMPPQGEMLPEQQPPTGGSTPGPIMGG